MTGRALPAAALAAALSAPVHAEMATYAIDPTHTSVMFEIVHNRTSTVRGRFNRKEGTIEFDRARHAGRADITVDVASVDTGVAPFNKNLLEKNWLDAAGAPTARFVGERFEFDDGDRVSAVSGQLTLLGRTLPVTFRALHFNCYTSPLLRREICGGDFDTVIQRSDFGMTWKVPEIPDRVRLVVQIEAIRQTP